MTRRRLDPDFIRSAPEIASIDVLVGALDATLAALVASHPCLELDCRCFSYLDTCSLAAMIVERLHVLELDLAHYRSLVQNELAEHAKRDPF